MLTEYWEVTKGEGDRRPQEVGAVVREQSLKGIKQDLLNRKLGGRGKEMERYQQRSVGRREKQWARKILL